MTSRLITRVAVSALSALFIVAAQADAEAQQALKPGDVLSGKLNAMRSRAKGKRVNTFQMVSEPRKLPGADGLCNLETGPETFQIVTHSDDEAKQLKGLIGKTVSIKVSEMSCAQVAGQMSDAIVTKWSVVR
ncbi:MAG: hypothetical protein A4S14_09805 [Proteobacteria bacterium SG_bin9]|nr:MAG: hypothetical protein A4S14_09805 [Proteobacteria bacterium SG_bin9]